MSNGELSIYLEFELLNALYYVGPLAYQLTSLVNCIDDSNLAPTVQA